MIDTIKARQEYQSWLRKGGDEIDWSSDRYGFCENIAFEITRNNRFFYYYGTPKTQVDPIYYFNAMQKLGTDDEGIHWRKLNSSSNFISVKEAQEECKKFLRRYKFKQLTGDDLIE